MLAGWAAGMAVVAMTRRMVRRRRIATGLVRATEATAERHRLTRHHTGCTARARNLMSETSETRERSRPDSALHRVQVPCALGRQWAMCAAQFDMKGRLDLQPIPTNADAAGDGGLFYDLAVGTIVVAGMFTPCSRAQPRRTSA